MAEPTPIPFTARAQDLTGQRFGRLIVLAYAGKDGPHHMWRCACDCGGTKVARQGNLVHSGVRSCGCLRRESEARNGTIYGLLAGGKPPEYKIWGAMIRRCTKPQDKSFHRYGGRGITVCDRWRYGEDGKRGFQCFIEDMGWRPSPTHQIERRENDQGYAPGNCCWATRTAQIRNRRSTKMVTFRGAQMPLAAAAELAGVPLKLAQSRIYGVNKWSAERALTTPPADRGWDHRK